MRHFYFFSMIALFLLPAFAEAQEITAKILDAGTREPIPYASVVYEKNRGVITNDEGTFSINFQNVPAQNLVISSLGYEPLEISVEEVENAVILLKPSSIELREVFLSDKELSAKEIIARVKSSVNTNYNFDLSQKRFFFRESQFNTIPTFDLEVDKSTMPGIDQKLLSNISENIPKISDSYKEVLGELYGNYSSQKVQIVKAANLHNPKSNTTLKELSDELEEHFKKNIKKNSYLKIRTGIIGFKMDAKELEEELQEERSSDKKVVEKTPEQLKKELAESQKSLEKRTNSKIRNMLNNMFWQENITFNLFEKSNRYKFTVEGYTYLDNETVYVVAFKPKRGADYKGKIYINTADYGVHRIDYENVKPLKKFRLFGLSAIDDIYRGKMIFEKDENGKYNPKFIEQEEGGTFGLDRPLTIIEKNKYVPGRRRQSILDLDIKVRIGQLEKYQLVIYESNPLEPAAFETFTSNPVFEYQTFKKYNPDFWNGYNIIEPNTAIKAFTALERR